MNKFRLAVNLPQLIIFIIVIFGTALIYNDLKFSSKKESPVNGSASSTESYEIKAIKKSAKLDDQVKMYKQLIERAGPEQAQDQLYRSGMPFDGQTHLLNHTIGDHLYDKYGNEGLIFCKDYFLSSCYHGFVIRAAADGGFKALKDIMDICNKKGSFVAIQCSHAIGHGLLAWKGYANLIDALKSCDKLTDLTDSFPLFNCHDGVFMENIWAVHEDGKPSKDRWLKDGDPIYPCNEAKIDYIYINACWSNQPMRMYQMFKGDLGKAGRVCLQVSDKTHQVTCFDGLARQIHPLTQGSVDKTFQLCDLMPESWVSPCVISITKAYFSVGDHETPFQICSRTSGDSQKSCYEQLASVISGYILDGKERSKFCNKIPQKDWRRACLVT